MGIDVAKLASTACCSSRSSVETKKVLVDSAARVGGADWLQQHVGERVCCSGVFFTLLAPAVGCRATVLERGTCCFVKPKPRFGVSLKLLLPLESIFVQLLEDDKFWMLDGAAFRMSQRND